MTMNPHERGRLLIDALLCGKDREAVGLLNPGQAVDFNIVNKGDNAIHLAARRGYVDVVRNMRSLGADLQQQNVNGNVAMHYAVKGGYLDLVTYLCENGADPNSINDDGESPLHEAVKTQTMDTIEAFIDLGMDPNLQNPQTGETPLHTALRSGAMEAMEGLLIKGAKPGITNNKGETPEDVAINRTIKETLRMYATLLIAVNAGYIKAKGIKISRKDVENPLTVARVGVVIKSIDIPKEFPTGFYCRREIAEKSAVRLKEFEEESVFSDIFHIRIFDVNRSCRTKIFIPIYRKPSSKEELVIRFIYYETNTESVSQWDTLNKVHYCILDTVLVPETTCTCYVNVRPLREKFSVPAEGTTIRSEMENDVALEVPPGSFENGDILSLAIFETNYEAGEESEDVSNEATDKVLPQVKEITQTQENEEPHNLNDTDCSQDAYVIADESNNRPTEKGPYKTSKRLRKKRSLIRKNEPIGNIVEDEHVGTYHNDKHQTDIMKDLSKNERIITGSEMEGKDANTSASIEKEEQADPLIENYNADLLTNVYEINVSGNQPTKGITVQIPLSKVVDITEEVTIVGASEKTLHDEGEEIALEVLPVSPKVVGMNLIFEVSHFSIYVASWKKKTSVKEELRQLQTQILNTRERRKPASFFAVVKHEEGRKHVLVVECVVANRSLEQRRKWIHDEGYIEQNPPETGVMMLKPGDTFCVDVEGNAYMENRETSVGRKLQFSQCRSSWQPYQLMLKENIYDEENAYAYVMINRKSETGIEEAARLRIKLTPPPPPSPTPPLSPLPEEQTSLSTEHDSELEDQTSPDVESFALPMARPKTAGPLSPRQRTIRPFTAYSRALSMNEEKINKIVNKITKPDYKPERSVGDKLKTFFRRNSSMN